MSVAVGSVEVAQFIQGTLQLHILETVQLLQ
jgi:hypothetical protein